LKNKINLLSEKIKTLKFKKNLTNNGIINNANIINNNNTINVIQHDQPTAASCALVLLCSCALVLLYIRGKEDLTKIENI